MTQGDRRTRFHPLTPERWDDFERLFGPHGAYGGCWCMWWRSTRKEFSANAGEANRRALKALVDRGEVPGLLAYVDDQPAGWCAVGPRSSFASLGRSRVLRPLDDLPVWSLVCFYVGRPFRGRGLITELAGAAAEYARSRGAPVIEAYPTVPRGGRLPPVSSFMGVPAALARAGFVEAARPSPARMVMRRKLD